MIRKTIIRLGFAALLALPLVSCEKTPTGPDGGGDPDTTESKSVVEIVQGWLS